MKKIIKLLTGILFISISLFTVRCKKDNTTATITNTAVIKLNGVQQEVDSVRVMTGPSAHSAAINVYLNHNASSVCLIGMYFPLSDPSVIPGASIDLTKAFAGGYGALELKIGSAIFLDYAGLAPSHPHGGSISITKNDLVARRIEGTMTNCIAAKTSGMGSNFVTIDGSFAVTY